MEIKIKLPALLLSMFLLFGGQSAKAQDDYVSLQQFYDELSPYGVWINDPQYGYVWRPDVDQGDFRPYYTNGRWAQTEYGNTWVSDYDWGWAPFHYGRWIYDRYNRWLWIPDTVWGPAWVDWRSGNGYYGWAPMAPQINIHIRIGSRYVRPDYAWNFITMRNIYYGNFPRYRSYNNVRYINRTTIINNTYVYNSRTYYTGPRPEEVRRATNQDVRVYNLARNSRADAPRIDRNTVNVYTPRPSRENVSNPAPRQLANGNNTRNNGVGRTENSNRVEGRAPERTNTTPSRTGVDSRTSTARPERVSGTTPSTRTAPSSSAPSRVQQNREGNGASTAPRPQNRDMSVRESAPAQRSAPQRSEPVQQSAPRQQQSAPRQQQTAPRQQQQRSERPQVQQRAPQQSQPRQQQSRGNSGNNNSGGGRAESGRPGRG